VNRTTNHPSPEGAAELVVAEVLGHRPFLRRARNAAQLDAGLVREAVGFALRRANVNRLPVAVVHHTMFLFRMSDIKFFS
jgi:hypothetical protein